MIFNGFDLSGLDQGDSRIVLKDDLVAGLLECAAYSGEAEVRRILLPEFFEWLENELYTEDWGLRSWEIAGETSLFKPLEQFSDFRDSEEMLSELEIDSPTDITREFVSSQILQRAQWCAESEAPGLHVFPLIIRDNLWFLIGAMQFWQGGVVSDWLGLTSDKDSIPLIVRQAGYYSTSMTPDDELISAWRSAAFELLKI